MIKFTRDSKVDTTLYEKRIQEEKFIYIDRNKLFKIREYNYYRMEALETRLRTIMLVDSGTKLRALDDENTFNLLVNYLGCPSDKFTSGNQKRGFSVAKTVLEPLYKSGYAPDFLEAKLEHAHLKSITGKPKNMVNFMRDLDEVDNHDRPIERLSFNVNQQQNLRYNYKDYDIVAIPREYRECIVAPKGKVLVWGDFAQADFRIAYNLLLRNDNNKDIFDNCEDKYEAMARVIARENKEIFDIDAFKSERPLYKIHTLATVYGKRSGNTREETVFIKKLARYLEKNERYMEFYKRIKDNQKLNLPLTVESYFGYQTILSLQQRPGKDSLNKALNTPMQTGTSELIIMTVNRILDDFYAKGFTPDDIRVYYVRHDEPVFIMDESMMAYSWMFKEYEEILVDDWTPLRADFSFGYTYSVEEESLMLKYKLLCDENEDNYTVLQPSPKCKDFYPVKKVLQLCIGVNKLDDSTSVISFVSCKNNEVDYMLVESTDDEELLNEVLVKLTESVDKIVNNDYGRIVVYSKLKNGDEFLDKISCSFIGGATKYASRGELYADYMAYKYNKKQGKEVELPEYINMRLDSLNKSYPLNLIN
ncbi:DNA polymerase [Paraclostridium bifermentans]|uniref:DNA polymerase n=1 Tax=Paraclostridium bifermentans TaxID=1490 RepID=UPI00374E9461